MPRVTTAYVSKFQRARIHGSRLVRGEVNILTADFNGILGTGKEIVLVTWQVQNPTAVILSNCTISSDGRSSSVQCEAGFSGGSALKCSATDEDGIVMTQLFAVRVLTQPWFYNDQAVAMGPYSVQAAA